MNRINCLTHQRLRIFERFQHLKILLKLTNEDQRNLHTEINNFTVKKTKKKKKKKNGEKQETLRNSWKCCVIFREEIKTLKISVSVLSCMH